MNFHEKFNETFARLQGQLTAGEPATTALPTQQLHGFAAKFAEMSAGLRNLPLTASGELRRGPPQKAGIGATPQQRHRARKRADRERCIAILDTETEPFDRETRAVVFPFMGVLYSDQFEPIVIWETDHGKFIQAVLAAVRALPEPYIIYAHNGGKFDYMFFKEQIRGPVKFKGRGFMRFTIEGEHGTQEFRDSLHLIPEGLGSWKKDKFDYDKNLPQNRDKYREEIIRYCIHDCKYLLQIVRKFIARNGIQLSIGQASMAGIRREVKFERIGELTDAKIRGVNFDCRDKENYCKPTGKGYFYGGRVECLRGRGIFHGQWFLVDVNSMYPYVMATHKHPVGGSYTWRSGVPSNYTCFVRVYCNNRGALIGKTETGETTTRIERGEFFTTIWEFEAALELGLISDVRILQCVDCNAFSDFSSWVLPLYNGRLETKATLAAYHARGITEKSNNPEYDDTKLTDLLIKYEGNNGYGKFAQNPRRYRDHHFTDSEGRPQDDCDWGVAPRFKCDDYAIWERKPYRWDDALGRYEWDVRPRFYNIGTGASITGAARAVLMRGLARVEYPIYCDTDSIICRDPGDLKIDVKALGAWKLEKTFDTVVIAGKKEYAAKVSGLPDGHKDRIIVKAKGVDSVTYAEMVELSGGAVITKTLKAPTMDKFGKYEYMDRKIRATTPVMAGVEYGHGA